MPRKPDAVTGYARKVVAGRIPAGPAVRGACARHLADLEEAKARGWTWDLVRVNRALEFFPDVLCLSSGDFEGKPFELQPWQAFIVGSLFGWVNDQGQRRFRVAFVETGKGSGKSPLAAGIDLYMLVADDEARAEVYAAALEKGPGHGTSFGTAVAMVDMSPGLRERVHKDRWCDGLEPELPGHSSFAIASDEGQSGRCPLRPD